MHEYGARAVIINVVGNDFDESLAVYNTGPGWWVYSHGADGDLHLRLSEYQLSRSALARYAFFNLQPANAWWQIRSFFLERTTLAAPRYAGNTLAEVDASRLKVSLAAIDAIFRDLPATIALPPDRILFTVDGFRYPDALAEGGESYFGLMRRAFLSKAESLGYEVIDLDPRFFEHYAAHGQRFEYPNDGHWNETGHAVAAQAVLESRLIDRLKRLAP